MNPKVQAILMRFALALVITEIPIIQEGLTQSNFDWRWLAAGLLGGLAGALEKYVQPQLLAVLADAGEPGPVLPTTTAPLKDVQLTPPPVTTGLSSTGAEASASVPPLAPERPHSAD